MREYTESPQMRIMQDAFASHFQPISRSKIHGFRKIVPNTITQSYTQKFKMDLNISNYATNKDELRNIVLANKNIVECDIDTKTYAKDNNTCQKYFFCI